MSNNSIHLKNIIGNYSNLEKDIIKQLTFEWKHGTTIGGFRESIWKDLFERIIPKKFKVESNVFVIDSKGHCSKEIDMAIYDEQYTPYIFNYGLLKFIPVEAVAACIECKSSSFKNNQLKAWADELDKLETSQSSIVRIAGKIAFGSDKITEKGNSFFNTQTATKPIKILCYIGNTENINDKTESQPEFDITIEANENKEKLGIFYNKKFSSLLDWYIEFNHSEEKEKLKKEIQEAEEDKKAKKDSEIQKTKGDKKDNAKGNESEDTLCQIKLDQRIISEMLKLKEYKLECCKVSNSKDNGISTTLLSFIFEFNQILMLINNPIFFPHQSYARMFSN